MQAAECSILQLSDLADQVYAGIGDIDLPSFKANLEWRFFLLQGILHKKVKAALFQSSKFQNHLQLDYRLQVEMILIGSQRPVPIACKHLNPSIHCKLRTHLGQSRMKYCKESCKQLQSWGMT